MTTYIPSVQSQLFNHMTYFTDINSETPYEICIKKYSIYYYIHSNPNFSKFRKIVDRAKMMQILNDEQANLSIFIPPNDYIDYLKDEDLDKIDIGTAKQIVNTCIIPKILAQDLITSSPVCYLYTRNPQMRMYVSNINGICRINDTANVLKFDNWCENGIIHIIDNLLVPNQNHFLN